ncbi:hypothetical protein Focb16_v015846 [Fusarium oxysporum f. sp. cubense]|uniref:Small EDRK-rich factor-like N-terminal domain-containing protein n=1 Tax=Fusarium oxysporum f. sp. cubense TaxID=61366 RepID=A0A559KXU1_FUSOC|nr:hypothetical protein Focb16_v015846 [Fusarium oxysporum f. sp. cubense]
MARGNQRDLARAKNEKKKQEDAKVSFLARVFRRKGSNKSGTKMQQEKETAAEIMRRKQAASEARKAAAGKT